MELQTDRGRFLRDVKPLRWYGSGDGAGNAGEGLRCSSDIAIAWRSALRRYWAELFEPRKGTQQATIACDLPRNAFSYCRCHCGKEEETRRRGPPCLSAREEQEQTKIYRHGRGGYPGANTAPREPDSGVTTPLQQHRYASVNCKATGWRQRGRSDRTHSIMPCLQPIDGRWEYGEKQDHARVRGCYNPMVEGTIPRVHAAVARLVARR